MEPLLNVMTLLPWIDWAAIVVFFGGWAGYAWFARHRAATRPSILATTNRIRRDWMLQTTWRDARVIDGVVIQNLSTSPSFFASTTILIIGGLLATLGTSDKATELVKEIPFAMRTSALVFDLKLLLMLVVFVYAFFRFTWSMRQYTFGALLIASAPEAEQFEAMGAEAEARRQAFADKAGRVVGLAAETFNDGLRAYYFSFSAIGWFFSPVVFMVSTLGVIYILYQREFRSEVLEILNA
ncbi:MAG TPA: DUF599 domain-containing protein [Albitalea sp.]|uniref:DUF599 domain-containing protein n=1 Tax=Piscinibacter sp. TaxID=1903157 RepID=UPI002ED518E1